MDAVNALVRSYLVSRYPEELVDAMLSAYGIAKRSWTLGDWHKTESHLGLFCEAAVRICRQIATGTYTEIGHPKFKVETEAMACSQVTMTTVADEPFRVLIPVVIAAVYAIRNRRGVDHLSKIKPNHIDAKVQLAQADWILAELTRLATTNDFGHVQQIIDSLVERESPLIEKINGQWKVLDPSMSLEDMILLVCYHDDEMSQVELVRICGKTQSTVSRALDRLDADALLHKDGRRITITSTGRKRVESSPKLRSLAS
jgi:hypothetical protein